MSGIPFYRRNITWSFAAGLFLRAGPSLHPTSFFFMFGLLFKGRGGQRGLPGRGKRVCKGVDGETEILLAAAKSPVLLEKNGLGGPFPG